MMVACATVALFAVPSVAFAQSTSPDNDVEVIVTATHRASTIQDVPFSINAQTQEDIQRSGAGTLEDLSRNVAGLTIQNLGPGQSQVALRGVSAGQIVRDQPGVKEQVGVYLDESVISLSLFTPDIDLYDLARVETLRGPQGTLFGSGSVGGTVRYITNQPNLDEQEGSLEANVNTLTDGGTGGHIKGMFNVPIVAGQSALRVVGYHTEYAGFIDALGPAGGDDVNSGQRSGVRAALTLQPTPNLTITPRIVYQELSTDGFNRQEVFNLYANPFTTPCGDIQRARAVLAAAGSVRRRDHARRSRRRVRFRRHDPCVDHQLHRSLRSWSAATPAPSRAAFRWTSRSPRRLCRCRRTSATPPSCNSSLKKCG